MDSTFVLNVEPEGEMYVPANSSGGAIKLSTTTLESILRPTLSGTCNVYNFVIEAVVIGMLCLFGYTGNTLSMVCLSREKSKTATPFLLISLEVADTLFLIAVFFIRVAKSAVRYTDLEVVMPVFPYIAKYGFPFALTAETLTIYLTLLVTINRYIAVCRPYEVASLCSVRHARKHVVAVTAFCVLYNLPRFFELSVVTILDPLKNRTANVAVASAVGNSYVYQIVYTNILYSVVMFIVPLFSLVVLNFRLIKALRKTVNKRSQMRQTSYTSSSGLPLPQQSSSSSQSEEDITRMLIVVVLVFVVCQTPALVTQLLLVLLTDGQRSCPSPFFYYERISDMLVVLNSAINFIIYCFCSGKFRQSLLQLLVLKKFRHTHDVLNQQGEEMVRLSAGAVNGVNNGNGVHPEVCEEHALVPRDRDDNRGYGRKDENFESFL